MTTFASGKVYVAGPDWVSVGDCIEGFELAYNTDDEDLDALAYWTPGPMSFRLECEYTLTETARRVLFGARWCYAHPRRLAINGSEYNRRRRNR